MHNSNTAHSHYRVLLVVFALVLTACNSPIPANSTASPLATAAATSPATGWLNITFTDPTAVHAHDYEAGPDEALAAAIDQARLTIDVAAYSFNLWSLRDALIHAHQRGVIVRMVMETDNMDDQEVQDMLDAGIPIVGDQHEGLMHDKFIVIDRSDVWTGSMNFTVGGTYKDNNNLIEMRSSQVAEDYTQEFEQMFTHRLFGPDRISTAPNPRSFIIYDTPLEIYFSPEDKPAARIVELIQAATQSIDFLAFSFTSNDIGDAILAQSAAGIKVAGVMDANQVKVDQGTEYDPFSQAGLNVRLDDNQTGLMHHKVIIIDKAIVITGSYNFTASAEENNDENLVIIFNTDVAAKYLNEFNRVYGEAQKP